jgi:hypothetical protein
MKSPRNNVIENFGMKRHISFALVLVTLFIGILSFNRSDLIAPLVMNKRKCGGEMFSLQRIELGSSNENIIDISYPVTGLSDTVQEKYTNSVSLHVIRRINDLYPKKNDKAFERVDVNIIFVDHTFGLNASDRFDRFGSRVRLKSPWVRILNSDWDPCSIQIIVFRQGRQIARDQIELRSNKILHWDNNLELTRADLTRYSKLYEDIMFWKVYRPNSKEILRSKIPPDVFLSLVNAPQTTISPFFADFRKIQNASSTVFTKNVIYMLDKYFLSPDRRISVKSIVENKSMLTEYESTGLRF